MAMSVPKLTMVYTIKLIIKGGMLISALSNTPVTSKVRSVVL